MIKILENILVACDDVLSGHRSLECLVAYAAPIIQVEACGDVKANQRKLERLVLGLLDGEADKHKLLTLRTFLSRFLEQANRKTSRQSDRFLGVRPTVPVRVVFENIRSAHNLGSMIRSCEGFGVEKIYTVGYTCAPESPKVAKCSRIPDGWVECASFNAVSGVLADIPDGYWVFGLETGVAQETRSIYDFQFPEKSVFLVGNECYGLTPEALSVCQGLIEIPMAGGKASLNVAVSLGILLFAQEKHRIENFRENPSFMSSSGNGVEFPAD